MPKISILMPIYNTKEKYLREAIESILNQTFTDFEFIILNDSPENTTLDKIVNSYNDSRIRYYKNETNLGISESRNKLLDLADGEYVAVADHDDISLPRRLELENNYLDNHPEIGVVSCNYQLMSNKKVSNYPQNNIEIKRGLLDNDIVLHTGMLIRKSVLELNKIKYESLYTPAEDYMLCIRLMKYTMFTNLKETLVIYRDHIDNTSHKHKELMEDAIFKCRSVAKQYAEIEHTTFSKYWIYLFKYIPILKIKRSNISLRIYLFGFLQILSIEKYY